MKLEHYKPTYRWVLLEPLIEEKTAGGLYLPPKSQIATAFMVVKVGPQCEMVKPGQRVIVEKGPMVDLVFDGSHQLYHQVLEMRVIGVEDDSSGTSHKNESALSGDSQQ